MWRSDGIPSSHPTFTLVLYNRKDRNKLHKLGSVCLITNDIDSNADIQELRNLWKNDDDGKKLQREPFTFASNIPRRKPYWVAKCHEFKSTSFVHSYINIIHPTIFIRVVLLNIMIVGYALFSQDISHVLMVIPMLMEN